MTNQPNIPVSLFFDQLEEKAQGEVRGEAQIGDEEEPAEDPEWAIKLEREEHRRLLADSHSTSLDLRWKLQHGEKRWSRERGDLLERFDQERQEWDGSMRELHRKMERVRDRRSWEETEKSEESFSRKTKRRKDRAEHIRGRERDAEKKE